ncbi:MerR family transcriptional regulator [Mycolicibacterium sp. XJ870]
MTEYRLEDLARLSGVSTRNIRAYRERGLLDPPRRVGRSAYYGEPHLTQLKMISQLLARGFNSAHIAEFFNCVRRGRDLAECLGIQRAELSPQAFAVDIDPGGEDARMLVERGLAEVAEDSVVLTVPALGDVVAQAADQPAYIHAMAQIAQSTAAAVDHLADLADGELARGVVSASLERALRRRIAG